jgi:hypothetical protein
MQQPCFTPQENFWYLFLLGAQSNKGPGCSSKDWGKLFEIFSEDLKLTAQAFVRYYICGIQSNKTTD